MSINLHPAEHTVSALKPENTQRMRDFIKQAQTFEKSRSVPQQDIDDSSRRFRPDLINFDSIERQPTSDGVQVSTSDSDKANISSLGLSLSGEHDSEPLSLR